MIRRRGAIAGLGAAMIVAGLATAVVGQPAGGAPIAPSVPGAFVPVTPANLLDTGTGVGAPAVPLAAHGSVTFQVAGRGGVPATGVRAVALIVAVVTPGASGYATVFPAGVARPGAASLDFSAPQTIANLTMVGLGTVGTSAGKVTIYNGSAASVRMVANISGYYLAGSATSAGAFTPVTPANLLDTGTGVGAPASPVAPGTSVTFQVSGRGGVPATGAGSAALVVAAVSPSAPGFATVYAADIARPPAAALDFVKQRTIANLTVSGLSATGKVSIYNGSGAPLRLVANVVGYFAAGIPVAGGTFGSLAPANLLDTGTGVGAPAAPVAAHSSITVQVAGRGGVPYNAGAVSLTVAAVAPSSSGYATIYPADVVRPAAAALDFTTAQTIANLAVVGLSSSGMVTLYNGSSSPVRLVVNVSGFWLNGPDTVATGPVSDLVASGASSTSVRLFWHNPTDRDFVGVKICRNTGTLPPPTCPSIAPALVTTATFADTGRTPGTEYDYEVYALDAAGNYSQGASASGTTLPSATSATGTITGTVANNAATPQPLSNVLVVVYSTADHNNTYETVTDANGDYSVSGIAPGNYQVCFLGSYASNVQFPLGFTDRCFPNAPWPAPHGDGPAANATVIPVTAGTAHSGVNGTLFPAGQISGLVTDAVNGGGLGSVLVRAFPVGQTGVPVPVAQEETDANGRYALPSLIPSSSGYYVCFDATDAIGPTTGYLDQCYKNAAWEASSGTPAGTAVAVAAAVVVTGVDAALSTGGAIAGTVTRSSAPVGGVLADVFDMSGNPVNYTGTASNGTYVVTGLATGTYFVCFDSNSTEHSTATNYLKQCYDDKSWDGLSEPTSMTATPVAVTNGATTTGVDALLPPAASISGTVTDAHGPVSGVVVTAYVLEAGGGAVGFEATTDSAGHYAIVSLAPHDYFVCFDGSHGRGSSSTGYQSECYNNQPWDGTTLPRAPTDTATPVVGTAAVSGVNAVLTARP